MSDCFFDISGTHLEMTVLNGDFIQKKGAPLGIFLVPFFLAVVFFFRGSLNMLKSNCELCQITVACEKIDPCFS